MLLDTIYKIIYPFRLYNGYLVSLLRKMSAMFKQKTIKQLFVVRTNTDWFTVRMRTHDAFLE
jgi:N-acetylglutamate synthase-like GNAT family acetyltransferase